MASGPAPAVIGRLRGKVERRSWPAVVLDVGGVGYELHVPLSTYERLPEEGGPASLEVLTLFRSESLQLYGFATSGEKAVFETLLRVSGIGPRLALSVLSGVSVSRLVAAVHAEDPGPLEAVPGIGKKTARRLLLELKDRVDRLAAAGGVAPIEAADIGRMTEHVDAVAALENLGYRKIEAESAVAGAVADGGVTDLADLIRRSLRRLRADA